MIFIGDIHGQLKAYNRIVKSADATLQVGDFGFGWFGPNENKFIDQVSLDHKFIRGNHDDPKVAKEQKTYLGDFGFLPDQNLFYLSGAWSFDWYLRTPNVDWWIDEELSIEEFEKAYNLYVESKPRIVVTHDCPVMQFVTNLQQHSPINQNSVILSETHFMSRHGRSPLTNFQLQKFFDGWQPELWIHGHHHKMVDCQLDNTRFVCLPALWNNSPKLSVLKIDNLNWNSPFNEPINAKIVNV